jgi:hypothetical protein
MPSTKRSDQRLALIDAAISFANGTAPSAAFGPLIARSHETLAGLGLKGLASAAGNHRPRRAEDSLSAERLWLRHQFLNVAVANHFTRGWRRDRDVNRALAEIAKLASRSLGRGGPRGLFVEGFKERSGHFYQFRVPLWSDAYSCAKDALALILGDYRGTRSRLFICPYGAPSVIRFRPEEIEQLFDDLAEDSAVHFFADLRFVKGTQKRYCTSRHQRAHYMQQYRAKGG